MDTFLNDVKFKAGDKITLTEEGLTHIRSYIRDSEGHTGRPNIARRFALLEVTAVKEIYAEDDLTELMDLTLGCIGLRDVETGETFDLSPSHEILWAFFTEYTPHFFNLQD